MAKASNNDFPSILMTEQAAKPSAPAAGKWRIYPKTDHKFYWEDSGGTETEIGGGGAGDVTWAAILASQLVNEIKGWPPIVNTGDLDALNLWWDKEGTPSTAPSVVALSGEGGITETWELALKVVADGANEGLSQTWTYADEPRLKSGRVMSALVAIWSVGAISVTAKLVNSDASETAASAVTAAAWTIVEIPNHTLAGTSCKLMVTAGAAGTFYIVPLGANIGARGLPLPPRPGRFVSVFNSTLVNGTDSAATWTDVDCTASTSPLAYAVYVGSAYANGSTGGKTLSVRRNGTTDSMVLARAPAVSTVYQGAVANIFVDDSQIFEYIGSDIAGDGETCYILQVGYWEWA